MSAPISRHTDVGSRTARHRLHLFLGVAAGTFGLKIGVPKFPALGVMNYNGRVFSEKAAPSMSADVKPVPVPACSQMAA